MGHGGPAGPAKFMWPFVKGRRPVLSDGPGRRQFQLATIETNPYSLPTSCRFGVSRYAAS